MDFWHFSHSGWYDSLSETGKERIRKTSLEKCLAKGEPIFAPEPDPTSVYLLESGLASLFRLSSEGEQLTFGFVRAGHIFGELPLFNDKPRETYARALEPGVYLQIPKTEFLSSLQESKLAALTVTKKVAFDASRYQRRIEHLVFRSVRSRLASVICELAEDFGSDEGDCVAIDTHFTQTEYAQLIGASRPSVNIAFSELQKDNVVEIRRTALVIHDRAELEQISAADVPRKSRRRK